jgi:hypothetical protein
MTFVHISHQADTEVTTRRIDAGSGVRTLKALILEAPHVFVEDLTVQSIAQLNATL